MSHCLRSLHYTKLITTFCCFKILLRDVGVSESFQMSLSEVLIRYLVVKYTNITDNT
jgi:hypothetical protein